MMINPNRAVRTARQNYTFESAKQEKPAQPQECCGRGKSLAMVYPVIQTFENLYEPADALCAGTLFKDLELPFHKGFRI